MCYDIKTSLEAQLYRAERDGDAHALDEIMERLVPMTNLPLHHSKGFDHPDLLIYTNEDPYFPMVSTWGLVPEYEEERFPSMNHCLNARGETIFKLDSFKESAKTKRCLIYVDGFYEHHHHNNKTYQFFIHNKNSEPYCLAGLWSIWKDYNTGGLWNTFAIVTTKPNPLLEVLHNNPKAKGPRMPVILPKESEDEWIMPYDEPNWEKQKSHLKELIKPYSHEEMDYYTVNRLRGKAYQGNLPNISEEIDYPEFSVNYLEWV